MGGRGEAPAPQVPAGLNRAVPSPTGGKSEPRGVIGGEQPPHLGLACWKRVRSSPWRGRAPLRSDRRQPRASRRLGLALGPRRGGRRDRGTRVGIRMASRGARSTPARRWRPQEHVCRWPELGYQQKDSEDYFTKFEQVLD